jgi:hypothetical protein
MTEEELLQAIEQERAAINALSARQSTPAWYDPTQLGFSITSGLAKGGAGLVDLAGYLPIQAANAFGAELPTFATTRLVDALIKGDEELAGLEGPGAAQILGVAPDTKVAKATEFMFPGAGVGKGKLATQLAREAVLGAAAYGGSEAGEYLTDSPYGALVGALAVPLTVQGATKAVKSTAPVLEEMGAGLQRKARGVRKSDYTLAKNAIIEPAGAEPTTQLKESLDNLIGDGTLGKSVDPEEMYPRLEAAKDAVENEIQATLQTAELKAKSVPPPSFDKTVDYISKNIAANDVDRYLNEVISLQNAIRREGAGSLVYLNQQRKVIGENWKNSPQSDPGFWRALYRDVKGHIEKYAPEVKNLNKRKQDLVVVSPIIERGFKASGAAYDISKAQQLLNTTGGAGLAGGAILGALGGNMGAGVLGALGLRSLATPQGQNVAGRALSSLGQALGDQTPIVSLNNLVNRATNAGRAVSNFEQSQQEIERPLSREESQAASERAPSPTTPTMSLEDIRQKELEIEKEIQAMMQAQKKPTPTTQSVMIGKQEISLPVGNKYEEPSLVKAVMSVESAGNPKAKSKVGASGLMQIMPATAKDLGLSEDELFDPEKNVEAGSRYLKKLRNRYNGDEELALAAYNWGLGNVDKALSRLKKIEVEPTWSNILDNLFVPKETRNYVRLVKNAQKKLVSA